MRERERERERQRERERERVQARAAYLTDLGEYRAHSFQEARDAKKDIEEAIVQARVTKSECLLSRCMCKPGWKKEKVAKTCEKYIRDFHSDLKKCSGKTINLPDVICPELHEIVMTALDEGQPTEVVAK